MSLTKQTQKSLFSAFRVPRDPYRKWYMIHDERANEELTEEIGLSTTPREHTILEGAYTVIFDWAAQRWKVR